MMKGRRTRSMEKGNIGSQIPEMKLHVLDLLLYILLLLQNAQKKTNQEATVTHTRPTRT